ncbi:LysM peptidoglycan-binding domain-containing protein [Nocardioides sp. NPDC051685]|uniref:LysM peptidoglycan-binding domain-containing protein n=1 Tax=Nocardioides sp. NPDC051685 TaxID=3364334 RepID=UPI0037ACF88E
MIGTRIRGLVACLAILVLLVGAPAAMLLLGAIPRSDGFEWRDLVRQDDGSLALQVITAFAWITWAWFAVTIVLEVVARLRSVRAPRFPGLPQASANRLVGAAVLLFVAVPAAAPAVAPLRATAPPMPETPPAAPVSATLEPPSPVVDQSAAKTPPTTSYTVKRGDSLWRIAESHLGAGTRFTEIVDLNPEALNGNADFLPIGLVLRLPVLTPRVNEETYVVQPGDTLAEIAQDELHDPERYPEIFDASRGTRQPDGERLTDPDLIRPGWSLTIPATDQPGAAPGPTPRHASPPAPEPPPTATRRPNDTSDPEQPSSADEHESDADADPPWLLAGLTGAGAVLAGGLFLLVRRNRRIQRRYRIPGHVITQPPAKLAPVEKSIQREGRDPAMLIEHLDRLLRMLPQGEQPRLIAVEVGHNQITLHLAEPTSLPRPWTGSHTTWTAPADAETTDTGEPAPYPLLASLGKSEDGHLWLLNLEEAAVVNLAGDRDRTEALTRHLAAELAVTPWSALVEVHLQRIGVELTSIDPVRLRHHGSDTEFVNKVAAELDPAGRLPGFDPDRYRAVLLPEDCESARHLVNAITTATDRPGAAVVIIDAHPDLGAHTITIAETGDLTITHPMLRDVHLHAAGLIEDEAALCTAIVEATRETRNEPMPVNNNSADDMEPLIDAAGALRPEYVHERPDSDQEPAGPMSLLPEPTETYARTGDTGDEIRQMAPVASIAARERVAAVDPAIDQAVAKWNSPTCDLPKLTLLGPVHLRANGDVPAVRRAYLAEMLTYLFLHPNGVSTHEFLDVTGVSRSRLTIDLARLRSWLGTNPITGHDHLPDARETAAAKRLGHPAYEAEDILVDFDLFRRLRARGEARGADGISDLIAALRLVSGEPFSQLRDKGWSWLIDGQRHDHIAISMIVDTAHIVVSRALADGDNDVAREAADIALRAAPHDDIPHLDFARVLTATGHQGLAEKELDDHIYNRDDGEGPVEPPARSKRAAG